MGIHQVKLQVQRSCGGIEQESKKRPMSREYQKLGDGWYGWICVLDREAGTAQSARISWGREVVHQAF